MPEPREQGNRVLTRRVLVPQGDLLESDFLVQKMYLTDPEPGTQWTLVCNGLQCPKWFQAHEVLDWTVLCPEVQNSGFGLLNSMAQSAYQSPEQGPTMAWDRIDRVRLLVTGSLPRAVTLWGYPCQEQGPGFVWY